MREIVGTFLGAELGRNERIARVRPGIVCVGFLPTFATGNSVGKGFGEARDLGGIFADSSRLRATETALSRVCGCKATER